MANIAHRNFSWHTHAFILTAGTRFPKTTLDPTRLAVDPKGKLMLGGMSRSGPPCLPASWQNKFPTHALFADHWPLGHGSLDGAEGKC